MSRGVRACIFAATIANLVSLATIVFIYWTVYNDGYYRGFAEAWESTRRLDCMTDAEIDYWSLPVEERRRDDTGRARRTAGP